MQIEWLIGDRIKHKTYMTKGKRKMKMILRKNFNVSGCIKLYNLHIEEEKNGNFNFIYFHYNK
jgi:hypothetical protein